MWILLACSPAPGAATDASDTAGQVGEDEPALDVLAAPVCVPGVADGRLDIEGGCADGVCLRQTRADADTAYGEEGFCTPAGTDVVCFYGNGIYTMHHDSDSDGEPDASGAWLVQLLDTWTGGTADGLALGTSKQCWIDKLGPPDEAEIKLVEAGYEATTLVWVWDALDLSVNDEHTGTDDSDWVPDGYVESLAFTDPMYSW